MDKIEHVIQLLRRAGQSVDESFRDHSSDGLTIRQYSTLRAVDTLSKTHGVPPSQTDLVIATGIDRSTMADVLRRLQRNGIVTRKRSKSDERRVEISITSAGRAAMKCAEEAMAAAKGRLSDLSDRDISILDRALTAIARPESQQAAAAE